MSNAPKRIWTSYTHIFSVGAVISHKNPDGRWDGLETQYIRADIVDGLVRALDNLLKVHEGEGGTMYHAGDISRQAMSTYNEAVGK